jgi:hypothetical protein
MYGIVRDSSLYLLCLPAVCENMDIKFILIEKGEMGVSLLLLFSVF